MAAPMTPSRFGASIGPAQYGDAISMADSLPSVDFGFDELRERMAAFTTRFDNFIARGRKRVLDERNAFRMNAAELKETQRTRRQAIVDFEQKSTSHANTIAKEALEIEELQVAIQSLQHEKVKQEQLKTERQAEVQLLQADIKQRRDAQTTHQSALDEQAQENEPELQIWENLLGLQIEGVEPGTEKLRFVFNHINNKDDSQCAYFEMDFAGPESTITSTKPQLSREEIMGVQQLLNESRDIATMLKSMRHLLSSTLKS